MVAMTTMAAVPMAAVLKAAVLKAVMTKAVPKATARAPPSALADRSTLPGGESPTRPQGPQLGGRELTSPVLPRPAH